MGVTQAGINSSGDVATEQKQLDLIEAIEALTVEIRINNLYLSEMTGEVFTGEDTTEDEENIK